MYFMATLCPVMVCVATARGHEKICKIKLTVLPTFDLSERSLCNVLYDSIFAQLGRWVNFVFIVRGRHGGRRRRDAKFGSA